MYKRQGLDLQTAVGEVVKETYLKHQRILFNGDGYALEWAEEAEKRGLLNLKTTLDAIAHLSDQKNLELFSKHGVLSEREVEARLDIMYDIYFKTVNIEGEVTESIATTQILPAALGYLAELERVGSGQAARQLGAEVSGATDALYEALQTLRRHNAELGGDEVRQKAQHMQRAVLPAMQGVRDAADHLEKLLSARAWPLPTYRQMLFVK